MASAQGSGLRAEGSGVEGVRLRAAKAFENLPQRFP